jgi:Tfp pilus assembly protein FimT
MKMRKQKGITVVEILVVLAMVGILLAMGLSLGKRVTQRADFTSAVNQFIADFNFARQLASRDNRYVAVEFNAGGTGYNILQQRAIGLDLSQSASYSLVKSVEPMGGDKFVDSPTNFAVNSVGIVRAYPININANPITVTLNLFKKDMNTGDVAYQKTVTIYPSGGVKVE